MTIAEAMEIVCDAADNWVDEYGDHELLAAIDIVRHIFFSTPLHDAQSPCGLESR